MAADAVLLVSPPSTHRALTEAALARGLHVVTEKPIALDLADAQAMADAGARAGLHVVVAQNYRFRRQSRALQQLVADGSLGRLLGIRVACRRNTRNSFIAPGDWRSRMAHPYLVDMAIHHVDMLRMITGLEFAEVDARGWHVPDHPFEGEPAIEALITFADGTPVAYEGTFAAAGAETSWNGDWELVGADARATWTGGVVDPLRGTVTLQRYGEPPARVALPVLPALDRVGVLRRAAPRSARRARAGGQRRRQPADVRRRPRDRALDRRTAARRAVKIGLFLALFHDRPLGDALAAARAAGCEAVEISTTGPHGSGDLAEAAAHGLEISALSCHGNPLHPASAIAERDDRSFRDTVRRAAEAGVPTVITFSGCPGESETLAPPELGHLLVAGRVRRDARVAVERARPARTGPRRPSSRARTGCAWRSSPTRASSSTTPRRCCACARRRARRSARTSTRRTSSGSRSTRSPRRVRSRGAIFHVHAKDTGFDAGRLDGRRRARDAARPGRARVDLPDGGGGARPDWWRGLAGALREAGYDGALSIEHEDPLLSQEEGLARAVETLRLALAP